MNNYLPIKSQNTYIFIDVSNIRSACLKTLNFMIDFIKLLNYFRQKYQHLREVRYYEGIASDDTRKRRTFNFLERSGYIICPLERKTYQSIQNEEHTIRCPNCKNQWTAKFTKEHKAMKSNIDVYLATDLLTLAHKATQPTHIILASCDGDYAEMIKNALQNQNISISVLATPMVKIPGRNTLSARLRNLSTHTPRYILQNINDLRDKIS